MEFWTENFVASRSPRLSPLHRQHHLLARIQPVQAARRRPSFAPSLDHVFLNLDRAKSEIERWLRQRGELSDGVPIAQQCPLKLPAVD
jgi:hypothetical protein